MNKIPDVLTPEEVTKLLSIPNMRYPTGIRNLCIMKMQVLAGCRISEVTGKEKVDEGGIRLDDIDLTTGELKIRNAKGGKERTIWLNESILESLRKWKAIRPKCETDLLFTTLKGGKIKNRYIRGMVKRYVERAGIKGKNIHTHSLRHTYATNFYNDTNNLMVLQKIIGHSNYKSTLIYTHISNLDVKVAMLSA